MTKEEAKKVLSKATVNVVYSKSGKLVLPTLNLKYNEGRYFLSKYAPDLKQGIDYSSRDKFIVTCGEICIPLDETDLALIDMFLLCPIQIIGLSVLDEQAVFYS